MKLVINPSRLGDRLKDGFKEVTERAGAFRHRATKLSMEYQDKALQLSYQSLYNQGIIYASTSSINQKLTREELFKLFDPVLQTMTEECQYDVALGSNQLYCENC